MAPLRSKNMLAFVKLQQKLFSRKKLQIKIKERGSLYHITFKELLPLHSFHLQVSNQQVIFHKDVNGVFSESFPCMFLTRQPAPTEFNKSRDINP